MKDDSEATITTAETCSDNGRPCAGGMEPAQEVSRRLKSTRDGRVKVTIPAQRKLKRFDPKAWYVAEVKRHTELQCRSMLNTPDNFDYPVEAYVATQALLMKNADNGTVPVKERIIIHGKVFIRVAQEHRIDLLRACPLLTRFVKDPALQLTQNNFTDFARVPDRQIQRLREILRMADGPVEYDDSIPQIHDTIQVIGGQLAKGSLFKDLKGEITMTNGRKYATVLLDGIGNFKFRLPVKHLAKVTTAK